MSPPTPIETFMIVIRKMYVQKKVVILMLLSVQILISVRAFFKIFGKHRWAPYSMGCSYRKKQF